MRKCANGTLDNVLKRILLQFFFVYRMVLENTGKFVSAYPPSPHLRYYREYHLKNLTHRILSLSPMFAATFVICLRKFHSHLLPMKLY